MFLPHTRLQLSLVILTVVIFLSMNTINEWLFSRFEFTHGISWVFLPAGMRLLSTLLFGTAGFVGLLVSGLLLNFFHFSFDSPVRSIIGAVAGSAGPYLVYLYAERAYGLQASLINLTPRRLLLLILICSTASPLFHHILFAFEGKTEHIVRSYFAMFMGDLTGTIIVIYTMKALLSLLPYRRSGNGEERSAHPAAD